jgi:hypothetical protein
VLHAKVVGFAVEMGAEAGLGAADPEGAGEGCTAAAACLVEVLLLVPSGPSSEQSRARAVQLCAYLVTALLPSCSQSDPHPDSLTLIMKPKRSPPTTSPDRLPKMLYDGPTGSCGARRQGAPRTIKFCSLIGELLIC